MANVISRRSSFSSYSIYNDINKLKQQSIKN